MMERRQFINSLVRWGIFTAMIALIAVFYRKGKLSEEACQLNTVCDKCSKHVSCELAQAKKQRTNGAEGK